MGDFFGLTIGVSSLFAHRQALETAGSNIANANTEGYSRQRVALVQAGGQATPAIFAKSTTANTGVMASAAQRMRDMFLEARAATEHGSEASLNQSKGLLDRVEGIFNEPSDSGLGSQMADFWAGWEDLANNPGDLAARSQLLQRANTVVNAMNQADKDLSNLWNSSAAQLGTIVTGMNANADRLAELNNAILRATADGLNANGLMDQRDQLVQQLGQAVGITTTTHGDGTMDVFVGGTAIVRGDTSSHLQVTVPTPPAAPVPSDVTNANQPGQAVQLTWVKDGFPAIVSGGESGGILDGLNRMLPQYRQGIDTIAHQLADAVNAQHNQGIDLNAAQAGTVLGTPQAAITIAAGVNDSFTVTNNAVPPVTTTITLAPGTYDDTTFGALQADLQAKLNAGLGPNVARADVRVVGTDIQVALTSLTPGRVLTVGAGVANALPSLGVTAGATATTDSFFGFTPLGQMTLAITDPRKVAAAMPGAGLLDGGNALNLSNIGTVVGGPDDSYRNFIIGLGVETQATTRRVDIQHSIVTQLDTSRDASAGVSLDEEMANLMQFQRGYEAAARLITTVDGMLDTLIHGTGLVGR